MESKFAPIIIIVFFLIIIGFIGYFAFNMLSSDSEGQVTNSTEELTATKPIVNIQTEIDEETHESAKIIVEAYTDDDTAIEEVVLPDGSTVAYENTDLEFTATKNGDYEFTVIAENGQSTTETVTISEINEISATNPYIPSGFSYVGGETGSGYVIEDEYGNQYVWVPVETGKLSRDLINLSKDYVESSTSGTALTNSVAKYYGFYIARFEASEYEKDGEKFAASMSGKTPWTNVNYQEALDYANASASGFGYSDCSTTLLSSYAWDTAIEWIDKSVDSYSSSTNYGNYTGTVYPTGYTSTDNVNNICDLAGNVREWTTETYNGTTESTSSRKTNENIIYRVIRGGSANLKRTPEARNGYDTTTTSDYWGFRVVIYK